MCFTFRPELIGQPNTTEKAESHQFANSETRRKSFCHSVAPQPYFYQGKGLFTIGSSLQFSELSTHWNRSQHFNFPCSLTNMTRQDRNLFKFITRKSKDEPDFTFMLRFLGQGQLALERGKLSRRLGQLLRVEGVDFCQFWKKIKRNPFDEDWLKLDEQHIFIQLGFPLSIFLKSSCL